MSNYQTRIKIKSTGEIVEAEALDNYFGRHRYGYKVEIMPIQQNKYIVYPEEAIEELPPVSKTETTDTDDYQDIIAEINETTSKLKELVEKAELEMILKIYDANGLMIVNQSTVNFR